jgi:hypothetical protein
MEDEEGNVVVGYTCDNILMLDIDDETKDGVVDFVKTYSMFHNLGKALVMKTSDRHRLDPLHNRLANYCIIFGKYPMSWKEISWHIKEARRLGMIEKAFTAIRKFGYTTIRVNDKNKKIPHPTIVSYCGEGDNTGCMKYLRFWTNNRTVGWKDNGT